MSLGYVHDEVDEVDLRLVAALQEEAKLPLAKLGEIVGLSAPSVLERIRKLEEAGVIRGYHAIVDARKVGLDITAFVGVSINFPKQIDDFEKWILDEPQVLECHHVTGGHTLLLKVKCRNTEALENFISSLRRLDPVERTETMVVLSTHAERSQLPLNEVLVDKPKRARRRKSA